MILHRGLIVILIVFNISYIFSQTELQIKEVDSLNSYAFSIRRKNPSETLKKAREAISLAKKISYDNGVFLAQRNVSLGFYYVGRLDSAIIHEVNALKNFEKSNDKLNTAGSYNRLGLYYRKNDDTPKAIEYYDKALKTFTELSDSTNIGKVLNNLAVIYSLSNNYDKALKFYKRSLKLKKKRRDRLGVSKVYNNMGGIYFSREDYSLALNSFDESLKLKKELKDTIGIIKTYENIGAVHKAKNNYDEAIRNYKLSLSFIDKINNNRLKTPIYRNLSSVYQKKGDYFNTFEYFHLHTILKDSLYSLAKDKQIAKIREEYETEKKDQTISKQQLEIEKSETEKLLLISLVVFVTIILLLIIAGYFQKKKANKILNIQKDNISRINSELESVNKTKDKLFSIIAHDIRSPIISLQNMTELMDFYIQENETEQFFKTVPQVNNAAKQLNLMMENLFNWSVSQRKNIPVNKSQFEIGGLIESCIDVQQMSAGMKQIAIEKNDFAECEISADLNMMRSVFNNLISNAIKFTPHNGIIKIELQMVENNVNIIISDTGIGIDQEKIGSIFNLDENKIRKGTDGEKGAGLGLVMCKEFIERNDGKISVTSVKDEGTKFLIELPVIE
ncbi:MAG: tetratricopeptide repeat protein [Rhodothermaceae bacterium]